MRRQIAAVLTRGGRDDAIAREKLPPGTRALSVDGVRGWLYCVTSALGDEFELFAWFDGSLYQVRVVVPDLWGRPDLLHTCHLFHDGRICFGSWEGGGMPTLEGAWARSVVWANGFSTYRRTGKFPF